MELYDDFINVFEENYSIDGIVGGYEGKLDYLEMIKNNFSGRSTMSYSKQLNYLHQAYECAITPEVLDTTNPLIFGYINMAKIFLGKPVDMNMGTHTVIDEDNDWEMSEKTVYMNEYSPDEYRAYLYYCFFFSLFHKNIDVALFCLNSPDSDISDIVTKTKRCWIDIALDAEYDEDFFKALEPSFRSSKQYMYGLKPEYLRYIPRLIELGYRFDFRTFVDITPIYWEYFISSEEFPLFPKPGSEWKITAMGHDFSPTGQKTPEYDNLIEKYKHLYQNTERRARIFKYLKTFKALIKEYNTIVDVMGNEDVLVNRDFLVMKNETELALINLEERFYDEFGFHINELDHLIDPLKYLDI